MTFKELQDAVIRDAFDESDRGDVQNWINHRYATLCDSEEWPFMERTALGATTAGVQTLDVVTLPIAVVHAVFDPNGAPLEKILVVEDFYERFQGATPGTPVAFAVLGTKLGFSSDNNILLGPTPSATVAAPSGYRVVYEQWATALVSDVNVPIIPDSYHMALVYGAKAMGARMKMMPQADGFEQAYQETVAQMRHKYIRAVRDRHPQSPAYRP